MDFKIVLCEMDTIEKALYRKAQAWFKECFDRTSEEMERGLIGNTFAQFEKKDVFQALLRLRQMALHWSLVMAGECKMWQRDRDFF